MTYLVLIHQSCIHNSAGYSVDRPLTSCMSSCSAMHSGSGVGGLSYIKFLYGAGCKCWHQVYEGPRLPHLGWHGACLSRSPWERLLWL